LCCLPPECEPALLAQNLGDNSAQRTTRQSEGRAKHEWEK
jgi:hypothetical protein